MNKNTPSIIGLMSSATAGKDTFYSLLSSIVKDKKFARIAFADALKEELDPLFRAFGGTAYETDPAKKALIRPVLVSHGMSKRIISNGTYWVNKAKPAVMKAIDSGEIPIITDVRFPNELEWVKSLGGKCVYIERKTNNGIVPPVNSEEAENDPFLRKNADILVSWPTVDREKELDKLRAICQDAWTALNS